MKGKSILFDLINSGRFSEAERYLLDKQVIQAQDYQSLYYLALCQFQLNKFNESEKTLVNILKYNNKFILALNLYLKLLYKKKQYWKIVEFIKRTKADAKNEFTEETEYYYVSALYKQGMRKAAKQLIVDILSKRKVSHHSFYSYLGLIYKEEGNLKCALENFDKALKINPSAVDALLNKAVVLSELRKYREAIEILTKANSLAPNNPVIYHNFASSYVGNGYYKQAESYFKKALLIEPLNPLHHHWYSQLRWRMGDKSFLDSYYKVLAKHPNNQLLRRDLIQKLIQTENYEEAEQHIYVLNNQDPNNPQNIKLTGEFYRKRRNFTLAYSIHKNGYIRYPNDLFLKEAFATTLLSVGEGLEALPLIEQLIIANKNNQGYWALKGIALRITSRDMYEELFNYSKLVLAEKISPPEGFSNLNEFNDALREVLLPLHNTVAHPLDQSLKNGTQTTGNLFYEENLIIKLLQKAIDEVFLNFISKLGCYKSHPAIQPFNGRFSYSGAWSVLLHKGGFHRSHFHSHGWFSGPYYVYLPQDMYGTSGLSGCLKLGEPGFEMETPLEADFIIKPEAGMLVRFPSFMWHGTTPFESRESRLIVASDLVIK